MELHKTPERTKSGFVLLDQNMRLVKPVNEYLDFQALRGRAENTLLAYGKDLKTFFEFLEQRKLQYDQVTANMIRDYVEYLRAPDVNTVYLFVESKRSPATINRIEKRVETDGAGDGAHKTTRIRATVANTTLSLSAFKTVG